MGNLRALVHMRSLEGPRQAGQSDREYLESLVTPEEARAAAYSFKSGDAIQYWDENGVVHNVYGDPETRKVYNNDGLIEDLNYRPPSGNFQFGRLFKDEDGELRPVHNAIVKFDEVYLLDAEDSPTFKDTWSLTNRVNDGKGVQVGDWVSVSGSGVFYNVKTGEVRDGSEIL